MINYIEVGGRCKQALYLRRHRCVERLKVLALGVNTVVLLWNH